MTVPARGSRTETNLSEFAGILAPQDGCDPPVVVGGHAVNLWSEYFLAKGMRELSGYVPFTSKDLDLVGSTGLLERLHKSLKGTLTRSKPRSPVLGRLEVARPGGGVLLIEVLHTVYGLNPQDLARTIELRIDGVAARVLLPHLILKAKIENCVGIGQAGRNDVKHVRMMILCVRAFMMEFLGFVSAGEMSERGLVNVLEETVEIVNGAQAVKAAQLWGFEFSAVWPLDELRSFSGDKITRWLAHRFP